MKDFFEIYPNAKSYLKVGRRVFLTHCKNEAKMYAMESGGKVEVIKNKPTRKSKKDNS